MPFSLFSRFFLPLALVLLVLAGLMAQKPPAAGANIVPNPGFERFANPPIGWTYKGADFGRVVKYWFSATTSSPDVYGPGVRVPADWAEKGFGKQTPHGGKAMAGLTVFGCTNGKPHCREFIEIQLAEPLVIGQTYYVEFWVCPMRKSLHINNLGAYFSVSELRRTTDEVLVREAQIRAENLVTGPDGKWIRVSGYFQARYEAGYILVGNFSDDDNTQSLAPRDDSYNYAYYYVDDVLVRKSPPYLPVPIKPDDLTRQVLEPGATIQLKNIYFEFDRDELMPRSFVELDKLLKIMRGNPSLVIEIVGHTDSLGSDDYNLDLSKRRAQAVVNFLRENKINASRLRFRGQGETQPVAANETDEGRAQNRRVEFVVVKK